MLSSAINLEDLEAFVAVAHSGSFRQASARLRTSQPTVTNRVQRLETCLGLRLFSRTTRRVSLTDAGARLLPRAERSLGDLGRLLADAREEAELKKGRISIGASPTVAASLLVPLLKQFMELHPDVEVRLHDDLRAPLLEALNSGRIDMAVVPLDHRTPDFQCEALFTENLHFVAPRSLSLATNRSYHFAEIADYPFVAMPEPSAIRSTMAEAFAAEGKSFRPLIEANSLVTLLGLVESGVGLTLLPDVLVPQQLLAGIDVLSVDDMQRKRQISLVTMRGRALSPAAAAFAKMIKVTLKRPRTRSTR